MNPSAPKTNPSAVKWSPKASPDLLKSIKKRVQDHPRTPLRKRTSPRCENPIIYYVFEVAFCENPIIYYVLSTSGNLIFLESDENTAPAMLLKPPEKPVLAREREARLFFKKSPKVSQRWSQVVPRGLPRPPKIDQKRSPRPSRDTFKKMNLSMLREPHYLLCF